MGETAVTTRQKKPRGGPVIRAMRGKAVRLEGHEGKWLRATEALALLHLPDSRISWLKHRVPCVRVPAAVGRSCSHGYHVWASLDACEELQRWYKTAPGRQWTRHEDRQIEPLLREGKSLAQIGAILGRSANAVRRRLVDHRHRGQRKTMLLLGYLTPGNLARQVGRTLTAVHWWMSKLGLPFVRVGMAAKQNDRFIKWDAFIAWLKANPEILAGLSPLVRRKIGLSADPRFAGREVA